MRARRATTPQVLESCLLRRIAMLRAAACALRAATSRSSPTLGHVRRFAEPSAAASASPEIERLKLELALTEKKAELALALEDKKVALEMAKGAQAVALEKEKAAQEMVKVSQALELEKEKVALEMAKAAQARGLWETLFGVKRETAQLLNLAAGSAVFIAAGTNLYAMSAMLHDSRARTQGPLSKAELSKQGALSKPELSTQGALSRLI